MASRSDSEYGVRSKHLTVGAVIIAATAALTLTGCGHEPRAASDPRCDPAVDGYCIAKVNGQRCILTGANGWANKTDVRCVRGH